MSNQHQARPSQASQAVHPRRPPAHKSVSLLHSPGKRKHGDEHPDSQLSRASSNVPSSDRANPPSPGSSRPGTKKESSGEVSDAGKWFETSNNNISQHSTSFVDNDPPFFFRNSSSSTSPDMRNPLQMQVQPQTSIPHRPAMMNLCTDGSSTEDFRSVIDDLTIENKKLKKKLKKYEKIHDAHLQDEKLFEVRMHGLPPHKKRELEETLRKFALALDDGMGTGPAGDLERPPPLHPQHTLSSYTSTQFGDSAYMSASGRNSNAASGGNGNGNSSGNGQPEAKADNKPTTSHYRRQQDSIQSYLQDIPPGLMPKTIAMTETAKKKLVVRRMEQIFAGKGAGVHHQQPMQQQEVAQSAAQADRVAKEQATGQEAQKEGIREARIMNSKNERNLEVGGDGKGGAKKVDDRVSDRDFADSPGRDSPDQRPTRPLDLDPQRAQVPKDNLNYIRHLGFSPPDPDISPIDGHGWIYLNLLVNMAQLHTINVTTEFVKKALQDYSSKLELSHDGRKVRWKGGHDTSLHSSDSSPEHELELLRSNMKKIGKKRRKLGPSSTNTSSETTGQSSEQQRSNPLAYTPLFYHKESTDEFDGSMEQNSEEEASPFPAHAAGNTSSGFASSGMRTSSSKRKRDDGPIIFYSKARFCTDLSGDPGTNSSRGHSNYNNFTDMPLGATPEKGRKNTGLLDDERRGPLTRAALHEMDIDMEPFSSSDVEFDLPDPSSSEKGTVLPKANFDFEASGIGGVVPEDNFSIEVECRNVRSESGPVRHFASHAPRLVNYPSKIMGALKGRDDDDQLNPTRHRAPIYNGEYIKAQQKKLPPSILPPPSMLPFDSSSGDADTDMSDVSEMDDEFEDSDEPPTAAPRLVEMESPGDSSSEDEGEADEEEEEDGSVDFLAQARELDPENTRAREREYDANMADRLAEEIPAGSSAATAGGGSGFNSPASLKADDENETGTDRRPSSQGSQTLQRGASLKRARTSDSMIVHGKASRAE